MRSRQVAESFAYRTSDVPKFPENGVLGNYDPLQSELSDKPDFSVLILCRPRGTPVVKRRALKAAATVLQASANYVGDVAN
jgi:hypothetical protein